MKKLFCKSSCLSLAVFFIFGLASCQGSIPVSEKNVQVTIDDQSRPNFVTFQLPVPSNTYDKLEWLLPSGEKISQLNQVTAYFPKKGTYVVKLSLTKGNRSTEIKKKVNIETDDPYVQKGEALVWTDEFDGYALNKDWWEYETDIHVNEEWQKYTLGDNTKLSNGILTITALKSGEGQKYGDYTSGRIKTEGKKEFTYGRMEIRAKLPDGRGTWPAIWMLAGDISTVGWPACGEIDIMEHVGFDPKIVHSSLHSTSSWGMTQNSGKTTVDTYQWAFHVYGMNWTPEKMDFYVDSPDNIFYTYNPQVKNDETWPFNKPYFFILNLAIGGHWGGKEGVDDTMFPKSMQVDYVRVYQKNQ